MDRVMNDRPLRWLGLVVFLSLITIVGCGTEQPLGNVNGKVTLNGEPVDQVHVQFIPDPFSQVPGKMAWAVTDADGRYEMEYGDSTGKKGAAVGLNKVTLQDLAPENSRKGRPPKSRVDRRFHSPFKTPLEFEVKEGVQTFDIEISEIN